MKPFTPSPAIAAFFNALEASVKRGRVMGSLWGGYTFQYVSYSLPPIPPRPTDPVEAAFLDNVCMALYNQMKDANDQMRTAMSS